MKKILLIIILISSVANAQNNNSVEKSLFTIQTGTIGIWVNNETRLADKIALRTEIGLYTEIVAGSGFFMAPEITLEPRWYYNLQKRTTNKRDVTNNSANFFTIKTSFRSDVFELSSFDDGFDRAENSFAIIPKWGIKRNLGKHLNYEVGLGVGYIYIINQKYFRTFDNNGLVVDLHVRIGFNF